MAKDTNPPVLETQYGDSNVPGDQISPEPHADGTSTTKVPLQTEAPPDIAKFMDHVDTDLMEKFGRFRILIIGRANAGKTTILQRICNSTEDPEIYNDQGEKVPFTSLELWDTDAIDE
jgi:hypothetical protein